MGHQHGRHFLVLGHHYGRCDVMSENTLYDKTALLSPELQRVWALTFYDRLEVNGIVLTVVRYIPAGMSHR